MSYKIPDPAKFDTQADYQRALHGIAYCMINDQLAFIKLFAFIGSMSLVVMAICAVMEAS